MIGTRVKILFILIVSVFLEQKLMAQDGYLLIQQYGKNGVDLENINLRKWNYDAHILLNYFNTTDRKTEGEIGFRLGGTVRYNFKKSYGLGSGIDFYIVRYTYNNINSFKDRIAYLSFPLTARAYLFKRITIEMGVVYNILLEAKGSTATGTDKTLKKYPKGTFANSFGVLMSVHYTFKERYSISLQHQFNKRSIDPLQRETNNLRGFLLGVHYTLLSPKT